MINLILWMIFVHWIADFVFQDDETALKKSSGVTVLACHAFLYFCVLMVGALIASSLFSRGGPLHGS